MKIKLAAFVTLSACASMAYAQSSTTIYGIVDTTARYGTNANANGDGKAQMADGFATGNRLGFRMTEDLGGGLKALAVLESGFSPDTGELQQGGRLFGRQSYVGIDGRYGKLLLGRQYTVAYDTLCSFDAFFCANNSLVGYQGSNYAGLRYDNTAKYSKTFGKFTVNGGYTFGETLPGVVGQSAKAASVTYTSGKTYLGAVYQVTDGVTSAYFNSVTAAQASKQTVWGLGGTYQFEQAKVFFGYTRSELDVADYQNDVLQFSGNYKLSSNLHLIGTIQHDKLKRQVGDGRRLTSALMLDYFLSKNTDVYIAIDYAKLQGGWVDLGNNGSAASFYGNNDRTNVIAGLRHKF